MTWTPPCSFATTAATPSHASSPSKVAEKALKALLYAEGAEIVLDLVAPS